MTSPSNPRFEQASQPTDMFNRKQRAVRRARMAGPRGRWFDDQMGTMLLERLGDLTRQFSNVLIIGARCQLLLDGLGSVAATAKARIVLIEQSEQLAADMGALNAEEDMLSVEPGSFDCVIWPGGLESVNDVPNALLRCRLALVDDGLLLGCFPGDGSFPKLRSILQGLSTQKIVARMQPQINTRSIGDLLGQLGMTMAVADTEQLSLSYQCLADLVADLRAAAWTNLLAGVTPAFTRDELNRANEHFRSMCDESGRVVEQLRLIHFSAWSPHASQPRPAPRGSGTKSLAKALKSNPPS